MNEVCGSRKHVERTSQSPVEGRLAAVLLARWVYTPQAEQDWGYLCMFEQIGQVCSQNQSTFVVQFELRCELPGKLIKA